MATTSIATGNALARKAWARKLWLETEKEIYFKRFMAEDESSIIHVKEDLIKDKGDKITFGIAMRLAGAGITGDSTLEGNEEAMTLYNDAVTVDQVRNGVLLAGDMTEQRTAFNLRETAKSRLKVWLAEKIDSDIMTALATSPTKIYYGGAATSTATLVAGDLMTPVLISKAAAFARTNDTQYLPVRVDGKDYYVLVVHPHVAYDLKQNATWTQAQREAGVRGSKNPIFDGALGIWDGVVIHEHRNIPIVTNWGAGANVPGSTAVFLSRQAGVFGWAKKPSWKEKAFDYGNQQGFSSGAIFGIKKTIYNAADWGVIGIQTARTNLT